jgi:hypothetical protein
MQVDGYQVYGGELSASSSAAADEFVSSATRENILNPQSHFYAMLITHYIGVKCCRRFIAMA